MKKKKIFVISCYIEKGRNICQLIEKSNRFKLFCAGEDVVFSHYSDGPIRFSLKNTTENPDLVIALLPPDYMRSVLNWSASKKIPVVIGTKEIPKRLMLRIKNRYSKKIPIFTYGKTSLSAGMIILPRFLRILGFSKDDDIETYSKGILRSASFLMDQESGLYTMKHFPNKNLSERF